MEDFWKLGASFNRTQAAQPNIATAPSALNQFHRSSGQMVAQPYIAQEVCVIERTIRQEPVVAPLNSCNMGLQGLSPAKLRSELLAIVSGKQQQQQQQQQQQHVGLLTPSSFQPSVASRSTYISSHPQLSLVNHSANVEGLVSWPGITPSSLYSASPLTGTRSASAQVMTTHASQCGQVRELSVTTSDRLVTAGANENVGFGPGGTDLLKKNLSFFNQSHEQLGVRAASQQIQPAQWLTETVSRQQRIQSVVTSSSSPMFLGNSSLQRNSQTSSSNLLCASATTHLQPASNLAPMGQPLVFCANFTGSHLSGELCLTGAGRLGVICSCHKVHMSVTKFTQHAGVYTGNPGEAVFMKGGLNLVEWRRLCFQQYGVKVPDDNLGWDWNDLDSPEIGRANYMSVSTECSRKDSEVCSSGKPPVATKSRTTEDWEASVTAAGNSSMSHISQTVFTSKHSAAQVSCGGQGGVIHKQQETVSKYVDREFRGVNTTRVEFESGHSFTDPRGPQGLSRNQANNAGGGGLHPFHNTSQSSQISSTGYHNFINDGGGHRYMSSAQQVSSSSSSAAAGVNNVKQQLNYPRNNWSDSKDSQLKEKDSSSSSSFELRLGQPSQYTQPSGSSISSSVASASSIEHQKSLLAEQVMHRAWDAKIQQQNIQNFSAVGGLAKISSNLEHRSEQQQHALNKNQSGYEGAGRMQSTYMDGLVEQAHQSGITASFLQSGRHLVNMQPMYPAANIIDPSIQRHSNLNPNCDPQQTNKVTSRVINGQVRTDRSVVQCTVQTDQFRKCMTVGNGRLLETQSSAATLAQLNNRTENQLLETAIQASFKYRSIGLEFSSTTANAKITCAGASDGYAKSSFFPSQAPSSNISTQNDVKTDTASSSDGVHDNGIARQLQQDPIGALTLRDWHPPALVNNDPTEQKFSLAESSITNEERRRGGTLAHIRAEGLHQSEDKSWAAKGREIQEQQQQQQQQQQAVLTNKQQDQIQRPVKLESDLNAKSPKLASLHDSGLSDGEGGRSDCKASHADCNPMQPHAETAVHVVECIGREGEKPLSSAGDPSMMMKVQDIQCNCFKCRKSSSSTRGQAVARIAGRVCLKEKGSQGTNTAMTDKNLENDCGQMGSSSSSEKERLETLEHRTAVVVPAKKPGNGETSRDSAHSQQQPLLSKRVKVATSEEEELSDDDVFSDAAAKVCTLGVANSSIKEPNTHVSEACSKPPSPHGVTAEACSKSSEDVRSGLSDEEGQPRNDEEEDMAFQGQSLCELRAPTGVHDEASEIGKLCSSDGGNVEVATNLNPIVSTAVDVTKLETPSSPGCPSCSNEAEKLMISTDAQRGRGEQQASTMEEAEEDNDKLEVEKVEQAKKRQTNLKWKHLDSNGGVGDSKKRKTLESGEYNNTAEQIQPAHDVDLGNQKQKQELLHEVAGEKGEDRSESTAGKNKTLKWRRVPIGNCGSSCVPAVELKGIEEPETFRNSEGDGPTLRRKNRTLVIRVPQGIFCERTKLGAVHSNHGLSETPTDGSPPADASDHHPSSITEKENLGDGPVAHNNLSNEKGSLDKSRSESPIAVTTPVAQNLTTKKFRSIRRPIGRPNPQKGRMLSLSNILKHRAERIDPQYRAVSKQIPAAKAQGLHERMESNSCAVATSPIDIKNTSEMVSCPEMGPPLESSIVGVLQKDEAQKVRSLIELTGKKKATGLDMEGFDIADKSTDLSQACKVDTTAAQTKSPEPYPFSESPCTVPRSGRSVRSNVSSRRNAQWHRPKDAQAADVVGKSNATLQDKRSLSSQAKGNCCEETDVTLGIQTKKTPSPVTLRQNFCEEKTYEIVPVRKKPRSSKVGAKALPHSRDVPAVARDVKVIQVAEVMHDDVSAANEVKPNQVPSDDIKSTLKKRVRVPTKILDNSVKRLKLADSLVEAKNVEDKALGSSVLGTSSHKDRVKKRMVASTPITNSRTEIEGKQSVVAQQEEKISFPSKNCQGVRTSDYSGNSKKSCTSCDVCGMSTSKISNKLLSCGRCPVKVHQACYGVPKVPKGPWFCRTCKFNVVNPEITIYHGKQVCILCGYGGGPMTCVQKTRGFVEGLLQAWRDLESSSEGGHLESHASVMGDSFAAPVREFKSKVAGNNSCEFCGNRKSKTKRGSFCKACKRVYTVNGINSTIAQHDALSSCNPHGKSSHDIWQLENTVTAAARDSAVKQWAHMVCTLWMPGTRCLNFETMGVFDVSGVTASNRKMVCSICKRKGGACIKCRLPTCSIPFHVWCAHGKGLLQSEAAEDGSDQVGFFGKCLKHGS